MSLRFLALSVLCMAAIAAGQPAKAASDRPEPIGVTDPRLGEILFHYYQDDYVPAIVLLQAARERGQLDDQVARSELLLGDLLLSFGQHLEAAEVFEDLHVDDVDRQTRDLAWLTLAKNWRQQGDLDRAQEALHHMSETLPDDLSSEARTVQAQIYLDSGQFDRAITLLQAWNDTSAPASYARFNLSVALLHNGQVDASLENLETLGNIVPVDEELHSLRDKANVTLGYSLLQGDQPQAAKAALQRVRSEGPFTTKALLGLGWADARLGNYDSALVSWMELRERDLTDPAVLESMIAVPYALVQVDSTGQAADGYRAAIAAFDEEANRIDRTIGFLESNDTFDRFLANSRLDSTDSYWQFAASPQMPDARYLFEVLATHEFHDGLKNYRDLTSLDRSLETWWRDMDAYASVLESHKAAYARIRPRIEDTLVEADFNELTYRQRRFAGLLDNVERFNDWLALANEQEFDTFRKVSSAQTSPALAAGTPEAEALRERIRWIKGVLQWELERKAEERLHGAVSDLRQTGELLTEAQETFDRLEGNLHMLPARFARLDVQTDELEERIVAMQMRVADTLSEQRAFLQSVAVGDLLAQKERLTVYTLQARLALAELYAMPGNGGGD